MEITANQKKSIPFKYAAAVKSGRIITGLRIKQAVNRFYEWVELADQNKFFLDHEKGMQIINFFETFLKHTIGKMAGQPFILSPFQQFTLYNVFGWQEQTPIGPKRRINNVYEKVGKKNGKTAVMAGVGLYCMSFDLEPGAQVYVGATKEEQAKICFNQAVDFIKYSPELRKIGFSVYQKEIKFARTSAFLKPLGGDSKTQDGIGAHLAIIDEYHAHPDDSVKENLESSMAARRQPIVYTITTAGVNTTSVCKKFEESCCSILDGTLVDDHFFIMIHDLDLDDDWRVKQNWIKANPNLGVSIDQSFLIKEFNKAKNQPSKIPNFKTKHLNMWVDAPQIWIPSEIWRKNKASIDGYKDYDDLFLAKAKEFGCYSGNDLSTRIDLSAHFLLTEPDNDGNRYIKLYTFCPLDTIDRRSKEDRVPYRYWADAGWLTATPGNTIDYEVIKETIQKTNGKYNVMWNEFDPWNASTLVQNLMEFGIENVSYFSQSIGNISAPTKQFEILTYNGKLKHNGNPILEWALSGCVVIEDPNANMKIHKGRSNSGTKRIDPIIAGIMALGGSMSIEDTSKNSKYNDPNVDFCFG